MSILDDLKALPAITAKPVFTWQPDDALLLAPTLQSDLRAPERVCIIEGDTDTRARENRVL